MKKIIIIGIVLLMSCAGFSSRTKSAVDSLDTSSINMVTESIENQEIKEEDTLIPRMKNKDIYMTCQNWDLDLYDVDNRGSGFHFAIYSHEPLNPEEIDIIIPIDAKYTFEIENKKDWTISSKMPLYLYQAWRGLDWERGGLLYQKMQLAKDRQKEVENNEKWDITEKEAEQREMDIIIKTGEQYLSTYKNDYNKLEKSDFLKFYKYQVFIQFEGGWKKAEKFEEIKVHVGDETYIQNIGEVRLNHTKEEQFYKISEINTKNGDTANVQLIMYVDKEDDLILNNIYVEEDNTILTNVEVGKLYCENYFYVKGIKQENWCILDTIMWDTTTPLEVTDVKEIVINVELEDSRLKQFEYNISVPIVLEYTCGQKQFVVKNIVSIEKRNDDWDTCAVAFYDVDVMDYYTYYEPYVKPEVEVEIKGSKIIIVGSLREEIR